MTRSFHFVLYALASAGLLASSLAASPATAQGSGTTDCAGVEAVAIADKDIIAAPRSDRLLALINFAVVLPSIPKPRQACAVTATAGKFAAERMATPQAQRFQKIEVILALVENMDEYARPNYAGMRHIGRMTFERSDGGLRLVQQSVQIDP